MRLPLPLVSCLLLAACAEPGLPDSPLAQQRAAAVPPLFSDTEVASGLSSPTAMAFAPDGRLFVCEQGGALRVIQDGHLLPEPFLTVSADSRGERGLLGVAFDPGFPREPYVYVYYTSPTPTARNRVSRFTASGNRAVPGSEAVLLDLGPLTDASIHNGGALHFGADGKLYIAVGDNARGPSSRELTTLQGKLLRLGRDGSIPSDNPFFTQTTGPSRAIWALGLRNPFSFAVQPGTGRIFINDVGQDRWEEINEGQAGASYGWPDTEGPTSDARFRAPLHAYGHGSTQGTGCAITGGTFYNPSRPHFPAAYTGRYFFADYCGGWIRTLHPVTGATELFAEAIGATVDLDVAPDGSLYYLDRGRSAVRRIAYSATRSAPVLRGQPSSLSVAAGRPATFTVEASGTAPLSYQWQRGGVDLPGATGPTLTLDAVKPADSGARFRVRVSNPAGSVLSNEAVLTVLAGSAPVATLLTPRPGTPYRAAETLAFSGTAMDAEDGPLPPSAFTWRVDFHHNDHLHPFLPPTSGAREGRFTVPDSGETSAHVWYRIHLTVRDSGGATHSVFRDVHPRQARLSFETQPPGLRVTLDGQPLTAPAQVEGVVGVLRQLGVESPQVRDGVTYVFSRWLHGAPARHDLRTPETDARYTAVFAPTSPGGLRAEYFDAPDFTGPRLERVDPTVDFRWGPGAPAPSMDGNTFSVRWTGSVVPRYSEAYTFHTFSNDGVRLWVDGQLLIDNWTRHTAAEDAGTLVLQAGRPYSLRLEFFEHTGVASIRLLWSSPRQRRQVVPAERLLPSLPSP